MKQKLKPCNCKDMATARKLKEQGISHNDNSIIINPSVVSMTIGRTTTEIPMNVFKIFAEWYLNEQEIK